MPFFQEMAFLYRRKAIMKKNVFIIILIVLITGIISAGLTYYFLDKKKDAEKEKEKEELREEYESRMEEREDGEL